MRLRTSPEYEGRDTDLAEWRDAKVQLAWHEDMLEREVQRAQKLRQQSNLGRRFFDRTFDNFDGEENADAKRLCKAYAELDLYDKAEKCGLIICGGYGTGKTHLAAAIANVLVDKGVAVLFDTSGGHLEKLKAEFSKNTVPTYLESMKNIPMLIIDDAGKEKQTEWSQSVLFDVINHRYEAMLPIIITSNFNQNQLEEYFGGATFSRLIEMCGVVVTRGRDRRRDR